MFRVLIAIAAVILFGLVIGAILIMTAMRRRGEKGLGPGSTDAAIDPTGSPRPPTDDL